MTIQKLTDLLNNTQAKFKQYNVPEPDVISIDSDHGDFGCYFNWLPNHQRRRTNYFFIGPDSIQVNGKVMNDFSHAIKELVNYV